MKLVNNIKEHLFTYDNKWNLLNMVARISTVALAWLMLNVSCIIFKNMLLPLFLGIVMSFLVAVTGYLYIPKFISSFNPVKFEEDKYFNSLGNDLSSNLPKYWGKYIAASIWVSAIIFFFGVAPLTGLLIPIILPTIYLIIIKCPYSIYYANHPSKEYFEKLSGVIFRLTQYPNSRYFDDMNKYYYDPAYRSSSSNIFNKH